MVEILVSYNYESHTGKNKAFEVEILMDMDLHDVHEFENSNKLVYFSEIRLKPQKVLS